MNDMAFLCGHEIARSGGLRRADLAALTQALRRSISRLPCCVACAAWSLAGSARVSAPSSFLRLGDGGQACAMVAPAGLSACPRARIAIARRSLRVSRWPGRAAGSWTGSWTGCRAHWVRSVLPVRFGVQSVQPVRSGRCAVPMVRRRSTVLLRKGAPRSTI